MKKAVVGILAHVDAGKTTLSEGMLYVSGNIRKIGRVDKGDAFLDTYDLERARGITIFSKEARLGWKDMQIQLLDTPGHTDFSAEMERTLGVLDYGILVISAADGVQGHTITLWNLLKKHGIPVFLFINKMDQERATKETLIEELNTRLGEGCVDFTLPAGGEFYENIAVCEESLLEMYMEQERIDDENIAQAVADRKVFPCYFGSALKLEGIEEMLEGMETYMRPGKYSSQFKAKVYKISRDAQGKRLTHLKLTGGSLKVKDSITGRSNGEDWDEKINQIRVYSGEKYEMVQEIKPGEICAVTGLTHTFSGQGLGVETDEKMPSLRPVLTYGVEIPKGEDPITMRGKLALLEEEEPQLHVLWNEQLQEIQIQSMGQVQIEILQSLLKERFGLDVNFGKGKILYKETIGNSVEGVGHFEPLRHYAEVHVLLEPGEPGSGLAFATDCSEDVLDKNWQRLILTHLGEKEHRGVLTGSALTDVKMTLINGRAHPKHTEGGDFRQATYRAVRQGLMQAESVLLEPFYNFRLEVPEHMVGRAMTDIEQMHGTSQIVQSENGWTVLEGSGPVYTLREYHKDVIGYTRGAGRFDCEWKDYEPCHNPEAVIEEMAYDPASDLENTADSVFCSHGAGVVIPWEEVPEHMHLPYRSQKIPENLALEKMDGKAVSTYEEEPWMGEDEVNAIIAKTFHANRKTDFIPHKGISGKHQKRTVEFTESVRAFPRKPAENQKDYLLVDGYNIIFAWENLKELAKSSIDGARGKLQDILCNYQGIRKCELILVFDAYRVQGHKTEILDYHNIHVVYTKTAETADQYIEKFAHENGRKHRVTVATSDGLEQVIISGQGCQLLSARELQEEIESSKKRLSENYLEQQPSGRTFLGESLSALAASELDKVKEQNNKGEE